MQTNGLLVNKSMITKEIFDQVVTFIEGFRSSKGYRRSFLYLSGHCLWCEDEGSYVNTSCYSTGAERYAYFYLGDNPVTKEYNDLVLMIRKARTELKSEIIESLLELINRVYDYEKCFEEFKKYVPYEDEEKKIAKCTFNETDYMAYIDKQTSEFYQNLEEVLKDCLP